MCCIQYAGTGLRGRKRNEGEEVDDRREEILPPYQELNECRNTHTHARNTEHTLVIVNGPACSIL